MKTAFSWLIAAAVSGFIAAVIGVQMVGDPNSHLGPMLAYFCVVSFVALMTATTKGISKL